MKLAVEVDHRFINPSFYLCSLTVPDNLFKLLIDTYIEILLLDILLQPFGDSCCFGRNDGSPGIALPDEATLYVAADQKQTLLEVSDHHLRCRSHLICCGRSEATTGRSS